MIMRALRLASALLLLTACVTAEPVRLEAPQAINVSFLLENDVPFPAEVITAVDDILKARNLTPVRVELDPATRLSQNRLAVLTDTETDALLVEAQAVYYSQLNGLMRWVVSGKVSLRTKTGEIFDASFDRPVFLRRINQDADDALLQAQESVTGAVVSVVDGYLRGLLKKDAAPDEGASDGIYFALVDRFKNGDPTNDGQVDPADPAAFHGGDLIGVVQDLERLKALHVSSVWLSPVYAMRTDKVGEHGAFHGYWVTDFDKVEPRFGGEIALKTLAAELKKRDMDLMLDFVVNHAGYEAPIVKKRPELFHQNGDIQDWNDPLQIVTYDVHGLPDFAQEREETSRFLIETHQKWVREYQPRRIRIDAAKHIDTLFLKEFTDAMREVSTGPLDVVGEYWDGNADALAEKTQAAGFDQVFDFPLYYALTQSVCGPSPDLSRYGAALTLARIYPRQARSLLVFADNHDLPRIHSVCGEDLSKTKLALAETLLARGTPVISWGTEVPLTGEQEPDNRADMDFDKRTLEEHIKALLALRAKYPELATGPTKVRTAKKTLLVVDREVKDRTLRIFAAGDKPHQVQVPKDAELLFGTDDCTVTDGLVALAQHEVCVFGLPTEEAQCITRPVKFSVEGAPSDRDVLLVGSAPELGGWDPGRAPSLSLTEGQEEVFVDLPCGEVFEYKLVLQDEVGAMVWQDGDNRTLFVPGDGPGELISPLKWNR